MVCENIKTFLPPPKDIYIRETTIRLVAAVRLLPLLIVFSLVSLQCLAFNITVLPIEDEIFPEEPSTYDVYVTNSGPAEDFKFVFSEDPAWSVITTPIYHQSSFTIEKDATVKTRIEITPSTSIPNGRRYSYPVILRATDGREYKILLEMFLKNPLKDYEYVPIVEIDVDVDSELDPRKTGMVYITLSNYNRLNLSKLQINVTTTVNPANDQMLEIPLGPLEKERQQDVQLNYDPRQLPMKDYITVTVSVPDRHVVFEPRHKVLQILPYNEVSRESDKVSGFMKSTEYRYYYNDGNVNKIEKVRQPTTLFRSIFTSTKPEALVVSEGGSRYFEWTLDLLPEETRTITITVNYWPLFIVFLATAILVALYMFIRSPIVISKAAQSLHKSGEEATRLKVLLHVKNRTGRVIDSVEVIDRIPQIAALENDFPVGTMQPTKVIRHEHKGTILKWVIPALEAYEERIISYKLTSKLPVVGGLGLSAALVKYRNRLNSVSKRYSGRA
jgi:hypothetical protein